MLMVVSSKLYFWLERRFNIVITFHYNDTFLCLFCHRPYGVSQLWIQSQLSQRERVRRNFGHDFLPPPLSYGGWVNSEPICFNCSLSIVRATTFPMSPARCHLEFQISLCCQQTVICSTFWVLSRLQRSFQQRSWKNIAKSSLSSTGFSSKRENKKK